jgi:hypothetical protein
MVKLATFCQECCFYSNEKCATGALDKFVSMNTPVEYTDQGPIVTRVCPYRRTEAQKSSSRSEDYLQEVMNEIHITGSIVLIAQSEQDLRTAIVKLSQVREINRFKIVVTHSTVLLAKNVLEICQELLTFTNYVCVKSLLHEPQQIIMEAFKRSKNGYLFILDASKDFDVLMIEKLNTLVNVRLIPVLHVKPVDDSYHQSATMSVIYKALNGDWGLRVSEKIEEIMQEEDVRSKVLTWEEVNEHCS